MTTAKAAMHLIGRALDDREAGQINDNQALARIAIAVGRYEGSRPQIQQRLTAGEDIAAGDPVQIADTCCGKCTGGTCYVDQVTGA